MKVRELQVNIYPTLAPSTEELLYKREELDELCYVCEKIHLNREILGKYECDQVKQRFHSMLKIMTFVHHMEFSIISGKLNWEQLMQDLAVLLPQFAWIRCKMTKKKNNRFIYYVDFIPVVYRETSCTYDIHLQDSIQQQLFYSPKESVNNLCSDIEQSILSKSLIHPSQETEISKNELYSEPQEEATCFIREATSLKNQLLIYQEELKRSNYTKERMRIANEKLEILIEEMERAAIYSGIRQLNSSKETDEDKEYLHIAFREYSYLMQKAKYLEKIWKQNRELTMQSEKTVGKTPNYKYKNQVEEIKSTILDSDVFLTMNKCREIEENAVINLYPWFRKPFVKLMKADYISLKNKAAYFDLLQGENYFLRKLIYDCQPINSYQVK
ncbi:hypothetical protein [Enterococcus sp. CWB-B31]|uniref:hypothetical protein n=1 Tax=Enterococcus sp. CWB-B31 TaxID=2885159 RepID=UPI001E5693A5|nr:hypothetical protein [Enterococcus sp. CWB-B31]MCB5953417.1 hypothetical protein [Enterococcus sp. CWB-B31]